MTTSSSSLSLLLLSAVEIMCTVHHVVAPKLRPLNNLNWVEINLLHQKCSKENISRCEANLEISTVHQRNAVGLSCLFPCLYFMFNKTNYQYVLDFHHCHGILVVRKVRKAIRDNQREGARREKEK